MNRRHILQAGLLTTVAGSLPASVMAAAGDTLTWTPLGEGLFLVKGAGSNLLVSQGTDGIALIDSGHADFASTLLREVSDRLGGVPELLFNSHCHRDQIGCNAALGSRGATIVAHENTRLWLTVEIISRWEGEVYPALPEAARPNRTFIYDAQSLDFNEPVEYGHLGQAHTDGDLYVFFPRRNLVFAGGVVSPDQYPLIDYSTNGWVGGMIDALGQLLEKGDADTMYIGSTGEPVKRDALEMQREMMLAITEAMGTNYYTGGTFEEFLETSPSAAFDAVYGNPGLFLYTAYQSVWGHTGDVRRYRAPRA